MIQEQHYLEDISFWKIFSFKNKQKKLKSNIFLSLFFFLQIHIFITEIIQLKHLSKLEA